MELLILPPMESQSTPETIPECTKFPVSSNSSPKRFRYFILKHANDIFLFLILKLFTLCCKERTLCNRWFLFKLAFISHLSSSLLETICLITVSSNENPLTSCCTVPSYPGASSSPFPLSRELPSLFSSLVACS